MDITFTKFAAPATRTPETQRQKTVEEKIKEIETIVLHNQPDKGIYNYHLTTLFKDYIQKVNTHLPHYEYNRLVEVIGWLIQHKGLRQNEPLTKITHDLIAEAYSALGQVSGDERARDYQMTIYTNPQFVYASSSAATPPRRNTIISRLRRRFKEQQAKTADGGGGVETSPTVEDEAESIRMASILIAEDIAAGYEADKKEQKRMRKAAKNKRKKEKKRAKQKAKKREQEENARIELRRQEEDRMQEEDAAAVAVAAEIAAAVPPTAALSGDECRDVISVIKSPSMWIISELFKSGELPEQYDKIAFDAAFSTIFGEMLVERHEHLKTDRTPSPLYRDMTAFYAQLDKLKFVIYILKYHSPNLYVYGGVPRDLLIGGSRAIHDIDIGMLEHQETQSPFVPFDQTLGLVRVWAEENGYTLKQFEYGKRGNFPFLNKGDGVREYILVSQQLQVNIEIEFVDDSYFRKAAERYGAPHAIDFDENNLKLVAPGSGFGCGAGKMFDWKYRENIAEDADEELFRFIKRNIRYAKMTLHKSLTFIPNWKERLKNKIRRNRIILISEDILRDSITELCQAKDVNLMGNSGALALANAVAVEIDSSSPTFENQMYVFKKKPSASTAAAAAAGGGAGGILDGGYRKKTRKRKTRRRKRKTRRRKTRRRKRKTRKRKVSRRTRRRR